MGSSLADGFEYGPETLIRQVCSVTELWLEGTVGLYKGRSALQCDACLVDKRRHVQGRRGRRVNLGDAMPPRAYTQARNARDTQRGRRGDDGRGKPLREWLSLGGIGVDGDDRKRARVRPADRI